MYKTIWSLWQSKLRTHVFIHLGHIATRVSDNCLHTSKPYCNQSYLYGLLGYISIHGCLAVSTYMICLSVSIYMIAWLYQHKWFAWLYQHTWLLGYITILGSLAISAYVFCLAISTQLSLHPGSFNVTPTKFWLCKGIHQLHMPD